MNGRRASARTLAEELARRARRAGGDLRREILICPPFTLLSTVGEAIAGSPIGLGVQDCHAKPVGAYTGDVSAEMAVDFGCRYAIVGHSERRIGHDESDSLLQAKAAAAHRAGLTAIVCIGETERQRDRGETLAVVERQFEHSIPPAASIENTVIAYEPVWAIGSGRTPTDLEIEAVHRHLRTAAAARLPEAGRLRLLYGGSVKAANASELLAIPNVDGALVGGASLNADEFWAIIDAA